MKILLISILVILSMTGCSTKSHFTYISNQLFNRNDFSTDIEEDKVPLVKGEDTTHVILFIPTKMTITLNEALDDAFDQAPHRDLLKDVNTTFCWWYIPYIYGQAYWNIEGSATKSK